MKVGAKLSNYLRVKDFADRDGTFSEIQATIARHVVEKIKSRKSETPEEVEVLYFREFDKGLILKTTNVRRLNKLFGENLESEDLVGKKIVLYVDPSVEMGGDVVGGVRIKV
jgi:hypothetical protein